MTDRRYTYLHMQDPFPGWDPLMALAYAAGSPFRGLKSFHPEDYAILQVVSPGTPFIYRFWEDHQSQWVMAEDKDAAAVDYISRFIDSLLLHIGPDPSTPVYVESVNEEYPTANADKLHHVSEFDRAFIRQLGNLLPGYRPIVFTAAMGNPGHDEYGHLVELARETEAVDGAFGYHGYWTVHRGETFVNDPGVAHDLHMRWDAIDRFLMEEHGIHVKWALGEIGATAGNAEGYGPAVEEGWRHESCWNGNEDAYLNDIRQIDELYDDTLAAEDGRLIGGSIFTSNPQENNWRWFRVVGSMAQRLADYVASGSDEPAPPATDLEVRQEIWEDSVQEQIQRGIPLNPNALLQAHILPEQGDLFTPVTRERRYTAPDGTLWAWQAAETVGGTEPRRVYRCIDHGDGSYGPVSWFGDPSAETELAAETGGGGVPRPQVPFAAYYWPVDAEPVVTQSFGARPDYYGQWNLPGHEGVDMRAAKGTTVRAVASGVVYRVETEDKDEYGKQIRIRHADGHRTVYAHLDRVDVEKDEEVAAGQPIGKSGDTGNTEGAHLHFVVKKTGASYRGYRGEIISPAGILSRHRPRGYPLEI